MKTAFLGPQGSFTHIAVSQIFPESQLAPQNSIIDCFAAIKNDECENAVVPLENSIEGTVSMTLDYLYEQTGIFIQAEVVMPIAHHLMVHTDTKVFNKILSHQQALAQCAHYLNNHYKDIPLLSYQSTAGSAQYVSEHVHEPVAAIANRTAARLYGLKIIKENIHDFEQNHTRFIVISKKKDTLVFPFRNTSEKTSLLITLPNDHAGGLHQVLSVFAWRRMNLSKIESRTLKTGLGNYFFFINVSGPWDDIHSVNALEELKSIGAAVVFLGHYCEYLLPE